MQSLTDALTPRGRAFVTVGIATFVCGFALGMRDLTRIGVILLALPVVSLLVVRRHRLDLDIERICAPTRVVIDEPLTVTVTMTNRSSRRTTPMQLEDHLDAALGERPRFVVASLRRGETRAVSYRVRSAVRGRHRLGPVTVRVTDPFGLTSRVVRVGPTTTVTVLPRVTALRGIGPRGQGTGAEGTIHHTVALHGDDDVSTREYRDGDDLRRIHWPATARTGSLMVRQEDRPATRRAVVLVDNRGDAHAGHGGSSSLEWTVTAAASVTAHLLAGGYAVHLITHDPEGHDLVRDSTDLGQALDALAVLPTGPPEALSDLIRPASALGARGGVVIAIVGGLDDGSARALTSMRQPGSWGVALVIDAASFDRTGPRAATHDVAANPESTAATTAAIMSSAGWSTNVIRAGTDISATWTDLVRGTTVTIGVR